MAKPNENLKKMASERDLTITQLIKQTVEDTGSVMSAATRLEVNPNTIRYHLKRANLQVDTRQVAIVRPISEAI